MTEDALVVAVSATHYLFADPVTLNGDMHIYPTVVQGALRSREGFAVEKGRHQDPVLTTIVYILDMLTMIVCTIVMYNIYNIAVSTEPWKKL